MIKCETPALMTINLCDGCKRATTKRSKDAVVYYPRKTSPTKWECDHILIKDKRGR